MTSIKVAYRFLLGFLFSVTVFGCNDQINEPGPNSFIRIEETSFEFYGRAVFTLTNGNHVILGSQEAIDSTQAMMVCYSPTGEQQWKKFIDGNIGDIWDGEPADDGGFYLVAYDSDADINTVNIFSVVKYDQNGEQKIIKTFEPLVGQKFRETIDMIKLKNGNIAICANNVAGGLRSSFPRLVILSPDDLTILYDKYYKDDEGQEFKTFNSINVAEGVGDTLFFVGHLFDFFPKGHEIITLKIEPSNFDLVDYDTMNTPQSEVFGSVMTNQSGAIVGTTAVQYKEAGKAARYLNYYGLKEFSMGEKVSLIIMNNDLKVGQRFDYDGFPQLGGIMDSKSTSDGGFICVGVCNMSISSSIQPRPRLFLMKVDQQMKKEWLRVFETSHNAIGLTVNEAPSGYIIGGGIQHFTSDFNMLFIKTGRQGN